MDAVLLEEVLSCPSLPSLPAVAVRVIELTSDKNVSLKELSSTIQNDQGLAAKVLRTVNSSYYGLRTRCATIEKALVMLGLAPVKALTLGFSLVSSIEPHRPDGFDYTQYWRRGLYTAVGARIISEIVRGQFADEAFLGGLLQDVGVVAMYRALGDEYLKVMQRCEGDHRQLAKHELAAFDIQHADVGAMLAQRWRLPSELVLPVRYHERPTAAPKECSEIVRAVGLGNLLHDALTDPEPAASIRRLYERAEQWFNLTPSTMDDALRKTAEAARELSTLFKLDTGDAVDADAILRRADHALASISPVADPTLESDEGLAALLVDGDKTDPITGVLGRSGFETALRWAFQQSERDNSALSLVEVWIDTRTGANARRTAPWRDGVLIGMANLLRKHFSPSGGAVCRLSDELFCIVVPGMSQRAAVRSSEDIAHDVSRLSQSWGTAEHAPTPLGVSIGVATRAPDQHVALQTPQALVAAAAKALHASRTAGGNCVKLFPTAAAA